MPIYARGNSFMVSVGSGADRFRQSYRDRREAQAAEKAALSRLKASGSPLEASRSDERKQAEVHTLGEVFKLVWKLRWHDDKHPETHDFHTRVLFRTIDPRTPVSDIDLDMIEEAVLEWAEEVSGGTINRRLQHLNTMLKYACEKGWISEVPKMPKRRENKHRLRWLSDVEEAQVLSKCAELGLEDLADFIVCAIDTGFRRSELLNFESRDFFNGKLHLHRGETKNDEARAVPATDRVRIILQRRSNSRKPFGCFDIRTLRAAWQRLRKAMNCMDDPEFVIHMLRHTCASRLVQNGVDLPVVQLWMGHKEIQTTMRYAHLAPNALQAAVAVLNKAGGQPELRVVNQ